MIHSIVWFRQDLRVSDHPALMQAAQLGAILPIYIVSDPSGAPGIMGSASALYLHYALESLNQSLNNHLNLYRGNPKQIIVQLIQTHHITHVFWNRCCEPWRVWEDAEIEKELNELKIQCSVCNGSYLWEPERIKNKKGSYYKVFGAYKRAVCLMEPRKPLAKPKNLILIKDLYNQTTLNDVQLKSNHAWECKVQKYWRFGEEIALHKLKNFLHHGLLGYQKGRDYPAKENHSKLSVHLHFGEISPHHIWESMQHLRSVHELTEDVNHFLSELMWREFCCYLITHFKNLPSDPFQKRFNSFPWTDDAHLFSAWKTGQTGYPIVDAGMRELWETGYMHNRVRMLVASFLIKNLMIHWHHGRDWFFNCLVDADLANNSANWQWVAGCGSDAAPYFRIFNPILQGKKFDAQGVYTRKFVPELKFLPNQYLFEPWQAPLSVLRSSHVVLGKTYPYPIIDWASSRKMSLEAYKNRS